MVVFTLSMVPALLLSYDYAYDKLGINPFETLMNFTGFWAILFLLLTLAITPLRRWLTWLSTGLRLHYGKRLSDWNFLIRSRRMLGLWSFFYAIIHAAVYINFEIDWYWEDFVLDFTERKFISVGVLSWAIFFVLALTSPMYVRKKMGQSWRRLHRLMYPLSMLCVLHIYLESKPAEYQYIWYACLTCVLLLHRLLVKIVSRWVRKDDIGLEVTR